MINLTPTDILLKAKANSKTEAIQLAGKKLVATGHIQAGYIESMLAREAQANTYLGNGIAIPHGQPQNREMILTTGIAVVQLPAGVEWNRDETVRLVVAIAAKSDEHLQILTNLTHVLDDPAAVDRLVATDDPQVIVDRLMGKAAAYPSHPGLDTEGFEHYADVTIDAPTGLHARPATVFADLAKSFQAEVRVRYGDQVANGKSLMSLLKLGVEKDGVVWVLTKGRDAAQALTALQQAVEEGLEEEDEEPISGPAIALPALELESQPVEGVAASPGLAMAPLHRFHRTTLTFADTATDPQSEQAQLQAAIAQADADLAEVYATVKARSGKGKAAIFQAHREFLADPELQQAALDRIPPNHSAPWAWQQTIEARAQELEALADLVLSGRAADVRDVGQRVLAVLVEPTKTGQSLPDQPVILLADDLAPLDTAGLDPEKIVGFCTAMGGATSHTAIIARSLNIPAMAGAGPAILDLPEGQMAILDGDGGAYTLSPPTPISTSPARSKPSETNYGMGNKTAAFNRPSPPTVTGSRWLPTLAHRRKPPQRSRPGPRGWDCSVKARLRGTSMQKMQRLAQKALACRTAEEVRHL